MKAKVIEVKPPNKATIDKINGIFSTNGDNRIIKNTPAVTIVAACNKELTGVGPSIASGNHVWKPNCADLPKAPTINKKQIVLKLSINIK